MASQGIVMVSADELCTSTKDLQDKEETLVVQHPVEGPPSPFYCWFDIPRLARLLFVILPISASCHRC